MWPDDHVVKFNVRANYERLERAEKLRKARAAEEAQG